VELTDHQDLQDLLVLLDPLDQEVKQALKAQQALLDQVVLQDPVESLGLLDQPAPLDLLDLEENLELMEPRAPQEKEGR